MHYINAVTGTMNAHSFPNAKCNFWVCFHIIHFTYLLVSGRTETYMVSVIINFSLSFYLLGFHLILSKKLVIYLLCFLPYYRQEIFKASKIDDGVSPEHPIIWIRIFPIKNLSKQIFFYHIHTPLILCWQKLLTTSILITKRWQFQGLDYLQNIHKLQSGHVSQEDLSLIFNNDFIHS